MIEPPGDDFCVFEFISLFYEFLLPFYEFPVNFISLFYGFCDVMRDLIYFNKLYKVRSDFSPVRGVLLNLTF